MLKRRFRIRSRLARPDFTSAHTRLHLREALHGQFLQQRLLRMSAVGFPLFGPSGSERAAVPQARLRSFIMRAEREARRRGRTLVPCAREVSYFVRTVPRGPLARPGWALWAFGQEGCLGSRGLRQCVCVPRDSGAAEDGQGPGGVLLQLLGFVYHKVSGQDRRSSANPPTSGSLSSQRRRTWPGSQTSQRAAESNHSPLWDLGRPHPWVGRPHIGRLHRHHQARFDRRPGLIPQGIPACAFGSLRRLSSRAFVENIRCSSGVAPWALTSCFRATACPRTSSSVLAPGAWPIAGFRISQGSQDRGGTRRTGRGRSPEIEGFGFKFPTTSRPSSSGSAAGSSSVRLLLQSCMHPDLFRASAPAHRAGQVRPPQLTVRWQVSIA